MILSNDKAIEVEELTRYYGELLAVDHVSFEVRRGEIFGFLGPNGAGKTTTIRMLTTLLEPTQGTARINGYDIIHQAYQAKHQFGIVPEESNVYTELSAWDNLIFTACLYRVSRKDWEQHARELLEAFGLQERRDVKVQFFSKGMRRRLTIAMALIHRPAILFLDEPIAGLDAQSARAIRGLVQELNDEGTTIFLTTHQIEVASQLCDRVAIIDYGKILVLDKPEKLISRYFQERAIQFGSEVPLPEEELQRLPGTSRVFVEDDEATIYSSTIQETLAGVMELAERYGVALSDVYIRRASLEDVFLHLTGRRIRG